MSSQFWRGRKVFVTGHTGFRGSWLCSFLQQAGAQVFGYSLSPASQPNFFDIGNVGAGMTSFIGDIRDRQQLKSALDASEAEVVFHLAGGGGLKESWDRVEDIYSAHLVGTVHLLECLKETATTRAVVLLSSDKVYRPQDKPLREEDPLVGTSPVATAKACVELLLESYLKGVFVPEKYNKHKIALASARMGAVIGGGDFANESLIWQLAQACQNGLELPLKNPNSLRAWMHIDDAVHGLVLLGQALCEQGPKISGAWNFGVEPSQQLKVGAVAAIFEKAFSGKERAFVDEEKGTSIHGVLDSSKAHAGLGWKIENEAQQALVQTALWYKNYFKS